MKTVNVLEINKYFNRYDLVELINEKGIENIKFIVPMPKLTDWGFIRSYSSSDPKDDVICVINESRYKVEDGYKISLVAEDYDTYGGDSYYQSDLAGLIKDGYIKILED